MITAFGGITLAIATGMLIASMALPTWYVILKWLYI